MNGDDAHDATKPRAGLWLLVSGVCDDIDIGGGVVTGGGGRWVFVGCLAGFGFGLPILGVALCAVWPLIKGKMRELIP